VRLSIDICSFPRRRRFQEVMAVNWPGLLSWSTKYHDGTAPSNFQKMSDEDRAFLEKAMEEAFGQMEDPNKIMQEAISQINAPDRTHESILTALEVVDRLCDDPDIARNIEKLDGLQALLDLVQNEEGEVRLRTLEILALLFSNNVSIQEAGIKRGALPLFLGLAKASPKRSEERSKAFRSLVSLIRSLPAQEAHFLRDEGGAAFLLELLESSEESRTREKAAAFILSMACAGTLNGDEVSAFAPIVLQLLAGNKAEGIQYRETMSSCMLELLRLAPAGSVGGVAEVVQTRMREIHGSDADANEEATLKECLAVVGGK